MVDLKDETIVLKVKLTVIFYFLNFTLTFDNFNTRGHFAFNIDDVHKLKCSN